MNKQGRAKPITFVGAIFFIIIGIAFLGSASSDPSRIIFWMGIIFLFGGIVSLIPIIIKMFKE